MVVTVLSAGFALVAAYFAGLAAERLRLPRLTGYLLSGMALGPYSLNLITQPVVERMGFVNGLAVAMIAFIAGLEMNVRRFRPRLGVMLHLGAVTLFVLYAGLFAACWFAWPWLGIAPELQGLQKAAVVAVLTTVLASLSPTITIAIISETEAEGPFTELTLAIVILADLALILLFSLTMQLARQALGAAPDAPVIVSLTREIAGSLVFGAAGGFLIAAYLRLARAALPVVVIGFCALLAAGVRFGFEPLLAGLAAGLVVENLVPPRGDHLREALKHGALPVFVVFFTAAGASLPLSVLAVTGGIALGLSLVRMGLILVGTRLATYSARRHRGDIPAEMSNRLWMGFVSQAGVTLGLTLIVSREFQGWGDLVQRLMICLIVFHELVGPVLFRTALARAGEIHHTGVKR